jgi:hypothetical protein
MQPKICAARLYGCFLHAASMSPVDNCNVSALIPPRKSSNGVLSSRLIRNFKSRQWLRKRLLAGFELLRGQRRIPLAAQIKELTTRRVF